MIFLLNALSTLGKTCVPQTALKASCTTTVNIYVFIVIVLDETSILVAVQGSMQNIYESCDLGRAVWRSNVDVNNVICLQTFA